MANPILKAMGYGVQTKQSNNIVEEFRKFRSNFKGDPNDVLNNMLKSGDVTQEQVNKAREIAELINCIKK